MFTDLNENTYSDAIKFVTEAEIMGGYLDASFKPNEPVTVAEFCRIIHVLGQGKESISKYTKFNRNYSYNISNFDKKSID